MTKIQIAVLEAVQHLEPNAYSNSIYRHLHCTVSLQSIYHALRNLEALDCVSSYKAENTPEVGGRGKRLFLIKSYGIKVLKALHAESEAV